ncbi:MAG: hypothetical protein FJW30_15010 [Acidobacteria bacterium]|nr:hypothetical protein [Acidobacteriota bacterium]
MSSAPAVHFFGRSALAGFAGAGTGFTTMGAGRAFFAAACGAAFFLTGAFLAAATIRFAATAAFFFTAMA